MHTTPVTPEVEVKGFEFWENMVLQPVGRPDSCRCEVVLGTKKDARIMTESPVWPLGTVYCSTWLIWPVVLLSDDGP